MLGVGKINIRKINDNVMFRVRSKIDLINIIIPIFDSYPMFTAKYWDYINFKKNLLDNVLFYNDFKDYKRPNLTPINSIDDIISFSYFDDWLVGFIEAKGCFTTYKASNDKNDTASFKIRQTDGLQIINAIKSRLSLKANVYVDKTNSAHLKTTSVEGIQTTIQFLKQSNAKLKGYKRLQYLLFLKNLRANPRYKTLIIPLKYGNG
nr:hypothetical protein [Grifola frondosa]